MLKEERRLGARQRATDDAKGRKPGQDRNPRGGSRYKRPYGEPEATAQENFTDPESRIMKTSAEGFQHCFNAQLAVDGGSQMIVATEVGQVAGHQGRLVAMLDRVEADCRVSDYSIMNRAFFPLSSRVLFLFDQGQSGTGFLSQAASFR